MTVGIGLICERGQSVVLAADRMITSEVPAAQHEGRSRKISRVASQAAVAVSGLLTDSTYVLRHMDSSATSGSVEEIADAILRSRTQLRRLIVENLYTKRHLGMDLVEFGRQEEKAGNPLFRDVALKLSMYQLSLFFLLGGVDNLGAHLFTINDATAVPASHDHVGFTAIGSGHAEAHVSLARRGYRISWSLTEALYGVYEAKRAAELAPGVGKTTDIAIICAGKRVRFLKPSEIKVLAKTYEQTREPMRLSKEQRHQIESHILS